MKHNAQLVANPKLWALSRQESIIEYYLGKKISRKLIRSPFREDKNPTCGFYYSKSGRLYLHDFATEQHMDCFEIVKLKFGLSYSEAIQRIIADQEHFTENDSYIQEKDSKMEFLLGDTKSLAYFHNFGITNETISKYKVFPAKTVYKNEEAIAKYRKDNPIFVYLYPSGRLKTYRPLSNDKTKKWGGNATSEDVQGIEQLPKRGQLLFITSSLKDVMVLRELGYNAIAFNGEGYGLGEGLSSKVVQSTITKLEKRFDEIVFYLDNDEAGIKFAKDLAFKFRKKYIHNTVGRPKDISDYVKTKSVHNGKRHIKKLLSKAFRVRESFLEYIQSISNNSGTSNVELRHFD